MFADGLRRNAAVYPPAWLVNLMAFQAGWWAVVLTASRGQPEWGLVVVSALVTGHLRWVRPYRSEAILLGLAMLAGLAFDSLLQASGWVAFDGEGMAVWMAPMWMAALWANFATTLNVSLRPLQGRTWLAAGLGGVGGPAAYWGGAELGAMTFLNAPVALAVLAAAWALLTPMLLWAASALARVDEP